MKKIVIGMFMFLTGNVCAVLLLVNLSFYESTSVSFFKALQIRPQCGIPMIIFVGIAIIGFFVSLSGVPDSSEN